MCDRNFNVKRGPKYFLMPHYVDRMHVWHSQSVLNWNQAMTSDFTNELNERIQRTRLNKKLNQEAVVEEAKRLADVARKVEKKKAKVEKIAGQFFTETIIPRAAAASESLDGRLVKHSDSMLTIEVPRQFVPDFWPCFVGLQISYTCTDDSISLTVVSNANSPRPCFHQQSSFFVTEFDKDKLTEWIENTITDAAVALEENNIER